MISLPQYIESFRSQNNAIDCSRKHAVIFGGTRGLGAATAEKFAELGASVTIIGRSREAGEQVLHNCQEKNKQETAASQQSFKLITADLSLLQETARIAGSVEHICQEQGLGLDYLILTAGCYGVSSAYSLIGGSKRTNEGIDYWLALGYLSRFLFIQRLLPQLLPNTRNGCCVVNVFRAGSRDSLDLNNLGLGGKTNLETISAIGLYIDAMTLSLAEQHPSVSFYHMSTIPMVPYPVVEDEYKDLVALSWILKVLRPWIYAQSVLAMEAAEVVVRLVLQGQQAQSTADSGNSANIVDQYLFGVALTNFIASPETKDRIWRYTIDYLKYKRVM